MSSAVSLEGIARIPSMKDVGDSSLAQHGATSQQFSEMQLPSFKLTYLFLMRILLDVVHECLQLRLEQRPATDPSLLSVRQVRRRRGKGGEGRGGWEWRGNRAECSTGKGRGGRGGGDRGGEREGVQRPATDPSLLSVR